MTKHNMIHKTAVALFAMASIVAQVATGQTMRGDFTMDGQVNASDAIAMINSQLNGRIETMDPAPKDTITVNGVSFVMVRVMGGTYSREMYVCHTVPTFSIGQTEVTRALWLAVMGGGNPSTDLYANYPITHKSWQECQEFVATLNSLTGLSFSLPTEDEWEYAACGGRNTLAYTYSGSNTIGDVAWYYDGSQHGPYGHIVATKAPNELGLYDMSGNIAEMCLDYRGVSFGQICAIRGGYYASTANDCKVTARRSQLLDTQDPFVGLRLVLHSNR